MELWPFGEAGVADQADALACADVLPIVALLYGYWFAMTALPVPGSGTLGQLTLGDAPKTMAAWWDRLLLDWTRFGLGNHTWVSSVTWDPEGLFSTIPAIGTAMLGNLTGQWLSSKRPPMLPARRMRCSLDFRVDPRPISEFTFRTRRSR